MSFWLQEDQRVMVSKFKSDKPNLQDKGKYSTANVSTSRPAGKGKEGFIYSNWSYVRFVGKAHEYVQKHVKDGDLLVLNSAMVSKEPYEKDEKTVYPTSEQIVIFDCSLYRKSGKGKNEADIEDESEEPENPDDDSIPF